MQHGLPMFFRRCPKSMFKMTQSDDSTQDVSLYTIIREIIRKTSDLKLKLREASKNMCIYLAHQSTIGPEHMVSITIEALKKMTDTSAKPKVSKESATITDSKHQDATSNLCNSTMWTSCISLLCEYQKQAKFEYEGVHKFDM